MHAKAQWRAHRRRGHAVHDAHPSDDPGNVVGDAALDQVSRPDADDIVHPGILLDFEDIELLSRMVDAMICEVALLLPGAENPKKLRVRGQKIIGSLLGAFRTT